MKISGMPSSRFHFAIDTNLRSCQPEVILRDGLGEQLRADELMKIQAFRRHAHDHAVRAREAANSTFPMSGEVLDRIAPGHGFADQRSQRRKQAAKLALELGRRARAMLQTVRPGVERRVVSRLLPAKDWRS